jgi:hypothetical protein
MDRTFVLLKSIAPFVSNQGHHEDGDLVGPHRFTFLTNSGGTLFKLLASQKTANAQSCFLTSALASGGLMNVKWAADAVRIVAISVGIVQVHVNVV